MNAEQLASVLKENFRGVTYDPKKRTGSATIPNVGQIEFHESANDPAVIVQLSFPKRFKGTSESAMDFLDALMAAWSNSD
jgi:hypothetical protein